MTRVLSFINCIQSICEEESITLLLQRICCQFLWPDALSFMVHLGDVGTIYAIGRDQNFISTSLRDDWMLSPRKRTSRVKSQLVSRYTTADSSKRCCTPSRLENCNVRNYKILLFFRLTELY